MFRAAADSLCRSAQAEQERIRRERGGDQLTLDDRARLLVELAPERVALAERLAELDPPPGKRRRVRRLVAAAERRGVASTEAGGLWKRGAAEQRIAAAAAREHDQRLRFVEIARGLGLGDCAEVLPPAEAGRIEAAAKRALTAGKPVARCRAFGSRYLEQEYGGGAGACAGSSPPPPRADRLRLSEVQGMAGVFAIARVSARGGGAAGRYRLRMVFEDGAWRVDKVD